MPYPEGLIEPMRAELTNLGVEELRTAAAVDTFVSEATGVSMLVVNSICGCAAGRLRPAVARALQHPARPRRVATVFAGADLDATARAREQFTGYAPSSPAVALLRGAEVVFMLERRDIERRAPEEIAALLTGAFEACQ